MSSLKEIAAAAGVSMTTVSNVINGNFKRVSKGKVEEIQKLIRQYGYIPNQAARNLAQGSSRIVAIIAQGSEDDNIFLNPFNAAYFGALAMYLYKQNYYPLLRVTNNYQTIEREIQGWNAAGVLITGASNHNLEKIASLSHIPSVLTDCYFDLPGSSYVLLDDEAGGRAAGEYLAGMGHRRVAFVANAYPDSDVDLRRLAGLRQALASRGDQVPDRWIVPSWDLQAHREQLASILSEPERPTAFFCSADFSAVRLIPMLGESGLRVPADISVIGFDNLPFCSLISPKLTTIAQDANQKARQTVNMLIRHIENSSLPPEREILGAQLVERESVRRLV